VIFQRMLVVLLLVSSNVACGGNAKSKIDRLLDEIDQGDERRRTVAVGQLARLRPGADPFPPFGAGSLPLGPGERRVMLVLNELVCCDPSETVRFGALAALGVLRPSGRQLGLIDCAQQPVSLAGNCVDTLLSIGDAANLPDVAQLLTKDGPGSGAALRLYELGPRAVPYLVPLVRADDPVAVPMIVSGILTHIEGREAHRLLLDVLKSPKPRHRRLVLDTLTNARSVLSEGDRARVEGLLADPDPDVREAAARFLALPLP